MESQMVNELSGMRIGVLVLSFVPLLVKAVFYASIGGFVPIAVLVVFGGYVWWSIRKGGRAEKRGFRSWGVAIVLWGAARLILMILFIVTPVSEAHVESQFGLWYVALSLAHIVMGVFLFRYAEPAVPTA